MRGVLRWLTGWWRGTRAPHAAVPARGRLEGLTEAALVLAEQAAGPLEGVLHEIVRSASHLTGAAAALALVDGKGRLERFAGHASDGCVRETLGREDVLASLVRQLRVLGRPLGPDDVHGCAGQLLGALAPQGFLVLPVAAGVPAVLVLMEPDGGRVLDDEAVAAATMLAVLAGEALSNVRRTVQMRESCEELRRLAVHVLAGREHEVGRTARQLHEGVCQRLAAANVQLQALDPLLGPGPDTARSCLRDARTLVNQAIGDLREIAQGLCPAVLEDFGYVQALRWYLARLRERTGLSLSLEVEGAETRLPADIESALYRATEDALAGATGTAARLRVSYRREPGAVQLEIAGSRPAALDVAAIRERLRPFRGTVRVTARPDAPAVIAVEVPVVN